MTADFYEGHDPERLVICHKAKKEHRGCSFFVGAGLESLFEPRE